MEWLSKLNFHVQQIDIIKGKEPDTGIWFLEAPQFSEWLLSPGTTLFCSGIPGSGKTMIVSIVIDYLLGIQNHFVGVAYIYCDYKRQKEYDLRALLSALLRQLIHSRPSIAIPINGLYEKHMQDGTKLTSRDISDALRATLPEYS